MIDIDTSDLDAVCADIKYAYQSKNRIIVEDSDGWRRVGRVGKSLGWKPVYLLMHRSSDIGSWDVLSPRDRVIGWETSHGHYVDAHGSQIKVRN